MIENKFKFNSEKFSERIKKLRLKHGYKQFEIADFVMKTRGAYGGCENGTFIPGLEMLIGIRDFYKTKHNENVSMDYLFGFKDEENISDQSKIMDDLQKSLLENQSIIKEKNDMIETQKELLNFYKKELSQFKSQLGIK